MPTILRAGKLRIAILTRNEHEPPHCHIEHPDGPIVVNLDEATGEAVLREAGRRVGKKDVSEALKIVNENFAGLLAAWEQIHR